MKSLHLLSLLFLLTFSNTSIFAQTVVFTDSIFKAALVNDTLINTNADSFIQVSEAQAYMGLIDVSGKNITNLTGIEAFTALTDLRCNNNLLTNLDVSAITTLNSLWCFSNQLNTLNISGNPALADLRCGNNLLGSLDASSCTALATLWCFSNQLTLLNISSNAALTSLNCSYNQLTDLDASANSNLNSLLCNNNQLLSLNVMNNNNGNIPTTGFTARVNPSLSCILVSDSSYCDSLWINVDPGTLFSPTCITSIDKLVGSIDNLKAYPNPTSQVLNIDLGDTYNTATIEVLNTMGQTVFIREYDFVEQVVLEWEGIKGLYFVNIRTESDSKLGSATIKVIKE